jgi:hypothetical protein
LFQLCAVGKFLSILNSTFIAHSASPLQVTFGVLWYLQVAASFWEVLVIHSIVLHDVIPVQGKRLNMSFGGTKDGTLDNAWGWVAILTIHEDIFILLDINLFHDSVRVGQSNDLFLRLGG